MSSRSYAGMGEGGWAGRGAGPGRFERNRTSVATRRADQLGEAGVG